MAPALTGRHHQAICHSCDEVIPFATHNAASHLRLYCPRCGLQSFETEAVTTREGESVWVDRTAFWFRRPQRWDVIAYRGSDRGLYVKRVIGLPGERVTIHQGDVFLDGEIVRKDFQQWRRTAQQVARGVRWWQGDNWQQQANTVRLQVETESGTTEQDRGSPKGAIKPLHWLHFRPESRAQLTDDVPFNVGLSRRLHPVRDLGISLHLAGVAPATFGFRWRSGGQQLELQLGLGQRELRLWHDGQSIAMPQLQPSWAAEEVSLEVAVCDACLWLTVNGRTAVRYNFSPPTGAALEPASLALGGEGRLTVRDPRVWRDIYYLSPEQTENFPGVQRGHYFVLGDNSPVSLDSRSLEIGRIPANSIIGKVLQSQR